MNACAKCGAPATALLKTRLPAIREKVFGCPVVLLNSVDRVTCNDCDHFVDIIPNHEGLIAAVAIRRIFMPCKLNGSEIRMLRKAMGYKATDFAKKLSVAPETVSRWEGGKDVIGNAAEKYLRIIAALQLNELVHSFDIDLNELTSIEITPMRPAEWPVLCFELIKVKHENQKNIVWDTAEAA